MEEGGIIEEKRQCYECIHNSLCPFKKVLRDYENRERRFGINDQIYEDLANYCLHYEKKK